MFTGRCRLMGNSIQPNVKFTPHHDTRKHQAAHDGNRACVLGVMYNAKRAAFRFRATSQADSAP